MTTIITVTTMTTMTTIIIDFRLKPTKATMTAETAI